MKKFCPGYTLIELLVVISLIGLLAGFGIAKYSQFNRRQIVVQAAQELKSNLRLAQDKALAGEKPSGWCAGAGEALKGYRLYFSSVTNYKIEAVCSTGATNEVKSVNLPSGVTGTTGDSVLFKVLAQGVEAPSTFILCGYEIGRMVLVEETGNIYIEEVECGPCPGGVCTWRLICLFILKLFFGWSGCNDSYDCGKGLFWCCCQR